MKSDWPVGVSQLCEPGSLPARSQLYAPPIGDAWDGDSTHRPRALAACATLWSTWEITNPALHLSTSIDASPAEVAALRAELAALRANLRRRKAPKSDPAPPVSRN